MSLTKKEKEGFSSEYGNVDHFLGFIELKNIDFHKIVTVGVKLKVKPYLMQILHWFCLECLKKDHLVLSTLERVQLLNRKFI